MANLSWRLRIDEDEDIRPMIAPELFEKLVEPVHCGLSIYIPIETDERDQRAPSAKFRTCVGVGKQKLEKANFAGEQRNKLAAELEAFADSADFRRHRDPGLAIFASVDEAGVVTIDTVSLPSAPPDLVVAGRDFHIKPLLPLIAANRRFGILALSKARVRLISATPFTMADVPLETLPVEVQAELDSRSFQSGNPDAEIRAAREALLASNPNTIEVAVKGAIGDDPMPIVLVADPHVAGGFMQETQIRQLHPQQLHMNPFALSDQELLARVMEVMGADLEADVNQVLDQANARLGSAEPTVAIRLEEILAAGPEGRVDAVVVAEDEALWGSFNSNGGVVAHGTPSPDDEDLLNMAAVLALRNGGRAFALKRARLPRQSPAVALFRY